ncbi:MAG: hypothetical protein EOO38_21315, partial [Cytophagaceae bacterium]
MKLDSVRELKREAARVAAEVFEPALAFGDEMEALTIPKGWVGLGISPAEVGEYKLAVRLQRRDERTAELVDALRELAVNEIDIRYVGPVVAASGVAALKPKSNSSPPLYIGCSIAHHKVAAGTLGAFVRPRGDAKNTYVLSNNHVLALENRAKALDAIVRPCPSDGGTSADRVAGMSRFVPLGQSNEVDCAIACIDAHVAYEPHTIPFLGRLRGILQTESPPGLKVAKYGKNGLSRGTVTAFEVDIDVRYALGTLRFENQLEIEGEGDQPFASNGDSGSLVVAPDLMALGMVFAVTPEGGWNTKGLTYA